MKTCKWLFLLVPVMILSILACRLVLQEKAPVNEVVQPFPAQVVTPTPTPTPTPTTTTTPTSTPTTTPTATPIPSLNVAPTPTTTPTPTMTPSLPYTILTPIPGIDRSKPAKPPPPVQNLTQFPPPKTAEEAEAQMRQREKELGLSPGIIQPASGPATMGGKVNIGKTIIKLPDDTYIDLVVTSIDCLAGTPCPTAPLYDIIRGKSKIGFSSVDGDVTGEEIALGEIGAFDFMKNYLKRKTPSPTTTPVLIVAPPAVTGPTTKGASIEIAGKSVKLPDDAYVDAFIISAYRFLGQPMPKVPYYRVMRGKSWIEFSAVDGEMVAERPGFGDDPTVISSLKNSLGLKRRTTY